MREIVISASFKKSLKRVLKNKAFKQETFDEVVTLLRTDIKLPSNYNDHILHGKLKGLRDCHIAPDIILMYSKDNKFLYLYLINIGSHSDLFL